MMLLGSNRVVTQTFSVHGNRAEDYSGDHLSPIKFNGVGKVIKVVNRFKCHEDTINENDFINNKSKWRDGDYYNCISITGKNVRIHNSEQGGNMIIIESYNGSTLLNFVIKHLGSVNVKVGNIINQNTIIGTQGNTGIVLSSKSRTNPTYGTHIHFEVKYPNGNYINPRDYAVGNIVTTYISGTNKIDATKDQTKVLATKINIRETASKTSKDLGDVYNGEIYTILDYSEDSEYDWYKINTSTNIIGWVANNPKEKWLEIYKVNNSIINTEETTENNNIVENNSKTENEVEPKFVFECLNNGNYVIELRKGEKLYIK